MVENKQIAEQIQHQRMDYRYRIHDNDTDIREPEDVYVLSEDFWSVFRDRYGCDLQIQVRKYKTLAEKTIYKPTTLNAIISYNLLIRTFSLNNSMIIQRHS